MSKSAMKMKSWQFFHFVRKHFGSGVLYAIFGKKSARTIDRWCEDPRTTGKEELAFDPVSGMKEVVELLDDHGHVGIIRAMISYLLSGTSLSDEYCETEIIEPKETITEEELLDFQAAADFHRAINRSDDPETVRQYKIWAIAELERTEARYRENMAGVRSAER